MGEHIFYLLVDLGGAPLGMRENFLWWLENEASDFPSEYRFIGKFGFGGKFRMTHDRWYMDYYPEDQTPELDTLERQINAELAQLKVQHDSPLKVQHDS